MKEKRVAIIVEFCLFLIGLLLSIFLFFKSVDKIHKDILIPMCISISTAGLVAFLIELPRYIMKHRMILGYIIGVARRIETLLCVNISNIEEMGIQKPQNPTKEYFYDKFIDDLRNEFFVFSQIDRTLFICICKKNLLENMIEKALHFTDQKAFTNKFNSKILQTKMQNLEIGMRNCDIKNELMQKQYLGTPITKEIKYEIETAITNEIVIDELHEMKSELIILLKLIDTTMRGILTGKNLSYWKEVMNVINSKIYIN